MPRCCLLFFFSSAGLAVEAQDLKEVGRKFGPPVLWVARPSSPPTIDGKLDDAAWSEAKPVALGFATGAWWASPSQKTEARVLADEKALYVAVRCFESEPERLAPEGRERRGAVIGADAVEIFLDPGHREKRFDYYHVIVTPKGKVYDGRGWEGEAWNSSTTAAAGTFQGGWTVEAAVPMADLGVKGDSIPRVWGLNVCRQRPELDCDLPKAAKAAPNRYDPPMYRLDRFETHRMSEHTSWSPTYSDFCGWPFYSDSRPFHFAERFGHAVLQVGTRDVEPPARVFEVLFKSDFDDGNPGPFQDAAAFDENFRGAGKSLGPAPGKKTIAFKQALENMDDVTLLMAFKVPRLDAPVQCLWFTAKAPDGWGCGLERYEYLITPEEAEARTKLLIETHRQKYGGAPPELYDTHADMVRSKPTGWVRPGPGPWARVEGYASEPSTGQFRWPGKDWVVVRARLGVFRRGPGRNKGQQLVPREQNYPDGFSISATPPDSFRIDDCVIFRGQDVEPPSKVGGVQARRAGEDVELSWERARDNTLTVFYRVFAGGKQVAETHQLSARLKTPEAGAGPFTVVGVDLYGNTSAPSDAVNAK